MSAIVAPPVPSLGLLWSEPESEAEPEAERAGQLAWRGGIGAGLADRYGGDLRLRLHADRPTMIANFVETVDGVVSMDAGKSGGADVSGHSRADRFVMALLRSLADAVVIGAGVLRGTETGARTPEAAFPDAAEEFARLRARLGLPPTPTTVILTRNGDLDPNHPAFREPDANIVVAGPDEAIERLSRRLPGHVRLARLAGRRLGRELGSLVDSLGGRVAVSEAGPRLAAQLVADHAFDELFVTVSPQLAGRADGVERLSMFEGVAFWPDAPRWMRLRSIRKSDDHLFLRYAFGEEPNGR